MLRPATAICLLGAALLAACPAPRTGGTAASAPPPAGGPGTGPATAPSKPASPPEATSKLDVAGVMLGSTPAMITERYPPQGVMNVAPMWLEDGRRGMLGATMKDGSPSPAESAWFDGGVLVGFTRTTQSSASIYKDEAARLKGRFGPPAKELPDWARDTEFAKNYTQPVKDMQVAIWSDKPGRALLLLIFDARTKGMMAMLVDVDRYPGVSRDLAERYRPAPNPKPQL